MQSSGSLLGLEDFFILGSLKLILRCVLAPLVACGVRANLGIAKYWRNFSVRHHSLRRTDRTKCGVYLLGYLLAAALPESVLAHAAFGLMNSTPFLGGEVDRQRRAVLLRAAALAALLG